MAPTAMTMQTETTDESCVECRLSIPVKKSFDLEKAVCSYGFFMMAPNLWVHSTRTLQRPLRLTDETAVMVCISQSKSSSSSLVIRVVGVDTLKDEDKRYLQAQVVRMLRLSETEESSISRFHALHPQAKAKGFGRLFRSPTLFEDMVKGILLCNCGWGRTLAMAKSLCELQSELKGQLLGWSTIQADTAKVFCVEPDDSIPKTPSRNDLKRKRRSKKSSLLVVNMAASKFSEQEYVFSPDMCSSTESTKKIDINMKTTDSHTLGIRSSGNVKGLLVAGEEISREENNDPPLESAKANSEDISASSKPPSLKGYGLASILNAGDFPTPKEMASLSENFLSKRCGLGYRAKRILKLAGDICKGTVDLSSLEGSDGTTRLHVDDLKGSLLKLEGFGPFTCANVLMCMGDYHTIPADSETVRHLKQVHGRSQCTVGTVGREVEEVYAQYAPFQFLAYWSEMWDSYEKQFGRLSQMPPSDYHLITGNNMKNKVSKYFIKP